MFQSCILAGNNDPENAAVTNAQTHFENGTVTSHRIRQSVVPWRQRRFRGTHSPVQHVKQFHLVGRIGFGKDRAEMRPHRCFTDRKRLRDLADGHAFLQKRANSVLASAQLRRIVYVEDRNIARGILSQNRP